MTAPRKMVLPKRLWAREKRFVKSSVPAPERLARCKGCQANTLRKQLRYGYCGRCWTE